MSELERFAKKLAKDTGDAITLYAKNLNKFTVSSSALKALQKLLRAIGKEAIAGKLTLAQLKTRLESSIIEYSKLFSEVITTHSEDLSIIMKNIDDAQISDGMTLENFGLKHDELIENISLASVVKQQEKKKPELKCNLN